MNGKEYLKGKAKVLDMRKTFKEQKTILADCYYWKDVYEALRLERETTIASNTNIEGGEDDGNK